MNSIKINGKEFSFDVGETIEAVARKNKIVIPTLCHHELCDPFTSCMVCVVKDVKSGRLIPSCSIKSEPGMEIETTGPAVFKARKMAIELLLSEHGGDCEAPCTIGCPASLNIPQMLRAIRDGKIDDARNTVFESIPFPSILGRICPAPCEGVCRRKPHDRSVAICDIKRFVGDEAIGNSWIPAIRKENGKKVSIIGSGIAGMTVAWYLAVNGYNITVFEKEEVAGGALRGIEKLPAEIIDAEIDRLNKIGVEFKFKTAFEDKLIFQEILNVSDALIIASGKDAAIVAEACGVEHTDGKIKVLADGFSTYIDKVFALGSAVKPGRLSVRSVGNGKKLAEMIDYKLSNNAGKKIRYNHKFPRMKKEQLNPFIQTVERINNNSGEKAFLNNLEEAQKEAENCLNCDCRKPEGCKLRIYATEYEADMKASGLFQDGGTEMNRTYMKDGLVYESSKCIRCGLCVRLSKKLGLETSFTFAGRGYDVEVGLPFGDQPDIGKLEDYLKCIEICPTGALSISEFS